MKIKLVVEIFDVYLFVLRSFGLFFYYVFLNMGFLELGKFLGFVVNGVVILYLWSRGIFG